MTKTFADELTRLADLIGAVWGGDDSISGEEIEGRLRTLADKAKEEAVHWTYVSSLLKALGDTTQYPETVAGWMMEVRAVLDQQETPSPSTTQSPTKEVPENG